METTTTTDCPACGGCAELLGALAVREHYRCRDCGLQYSRVRGDLPATPPVKGATALTPAGLREAAEAFDNGAARREAKAQVRCLRPHYRRWLREQAAKDRAAAQTAREMATDLERRLAERAALERRAELL